MRIMTSLAAAAFAVASIWNVHARDYYVDAVNGNDANDGLAAGEGHAMESFAALFTKYTITSGDKVHAAAGIYTNGVMRTTINRVSTAFRLVVPAGVEIIGAGADSTTIEGQAHTNELGEVADLTASPFGCGANALRGAFLGQGAILRKFTITKAYSSGYTDGTDGNGGGVSSESGKAGYLIDCVVTGCVGARGAGSAYITAIRCSFYDNRSGNTGSDIFSGKAFNCLFGDVLTANTYNIYQGGPHVNNTFYGSGYCNHAPNGSNRVLYNSVVLKDATGNNTYYTNCIVHASKGTIGAGSTYVSSDAAAKLDTNWRPHRDSPCVDAGSADWYDSFPSELLDEKTRDLLSATRIQGSSIDIGACESPFTKNGSFDWHVDAVNGDDANDGTSASAAFQNLSRALTNSYLRTCDIVHAAPGMYTNGVMVQYGRNFRAAIQPGVTLVGDAGAESTFIVGAKDDENGTVENYGCGPNAVSCVFIGESSKVKGFTLTGGRVPDYGNTQSSSGWAGAVFNGDNRSNVLKTGFVVDCIVTNNYGARAAGCMGGILIRCRFGDNWVATSGCDAYVSLAYNCLFGDVGNTSSACNAYAGGPYINCTFTGAGSGASAAANGPVAILNCLVLKDVSNNLRLTNCVYTGTLGTGSTVFNSINKTSVDAARIATDLRPLRGSPALDSSNADLYTTLPTFLSDALKSELLSELGAVDLAKSSRVQGQGLDIGAFESSATTASRNWYVDKMNGNDANYGLTAETAFKTFAAAMAAPELISNDVVNVAAGVYSDADGIMTDGGRNYRVVVPAGVTLQGAGTNETVIEGAEDRVNGTEEGHYCGSDAVSCVRLNAGSMVRGFTLTKGHVPAWEASNSINWGGAAVASAAYVVDCVITNNFAGRGAGLHGGTAIRCRFNGNGVLSTGTDIMQGRAFNCLFGSIVNTDAVNVYQGGPYVNCVFYGTGSVLYDSSKLSTNIWNSVIMKDRGRNVAYAYCVTTKSVSANDVNTRQISEANMKLDEHYVPQPGSPLIDMGRTDFYSSAFPTVVTAMFAKTDLANSQRIYNGAIDIGAFEYDWRGDFAERLRRSRFEVVEASESVVTNGTDALTVPANSSVEIAWTLSRNGNHSFRAVPVGEDTLATLTLNGETVAPAADGVYTFVGVKDTTVTIAVTSADSESAVLRDFTGPGRMVLSFR